MSNYTLNNVVSSSENPNVSYCNSWLKVENNANRPFFAQAAYVTNFDDLSISLSANDVNIGSVHITDSITGLAADVVPIGAGSGALRVISQDLESTQDDITVGDRDGNFAAVNSALSALKVYVSNPVTAITEPDPTQLDAFGRLRVSNPITLFDSSHRYKDNDLWASSTSVGGSYSFNENQGCIDLTVSTSSGSTVIRETKKTFAYQPGKSLLVLNSFVMAPSATTLKQRVGYFGSDNGIFLQLENDVISFVKRTSVGGSLSDIPVQRSAWNGDKLDGTGESGITLDITKSQILWTDIEWLGVGTVRVGFVIDGKFIVCHSFHHANKLANTYITTACLPIRYEITNTSNAGFQSTLKQICSSVISEGGYELRGEQKQVGTAIQTPKALATAGAFYPVVTLRLKSTKKDAIVILSAISLLGKTNAYYNWKLIAAGTTAGGSGTWLTTGADSSVEYKLDATSITGGRTLAGGFFATSNQGSTQIDISKENLFKFQLERDSLNSSYYEMTLVIASDTDTNTAYGSMDWEEVTR